MPDPRARSWRLVWAFVALLGLALAIGIALRSARDVRETAETDRRAGAVDSPATPALDAAELEGAQRAEAPATRGPADAADAADAGARLIVRVLRGAAGEPVAGGAVTVRRLGVDPSPIASATTDASGACELPVPAGVELVARAAAEGGRPARIATLAALAPGEARAVSITLPDPGAPFFGRVVAEEGGAPVEGARVSTGRAADPTGGEAAVADAEGVFSLSAARQGESPSWRVDAPGFGPTWFSALAGHATRETALILPLRRAGGLAVRVTQPATQETALALRVVARKEVLGAFDDAFDLFGAVTWSAELDRSGRAAIAHLPALVPLQVELVAGNHVAWKHPGAVALAPGEERVLGIDLAYRAAVRVALSDQDGAPIAGAEIWLASEVLAAPPAGDSAHFFPEDRAHVVARARSDARGEATFRDVAAGRWWVGPQPPGDWGAAGEIFPRARAVDVLPGVADVAVAIVAERGLRIRGTVVGPDGAPVADATFGCLSRDPYLWIGGPIDAQGAFVAGPLCDAEYELSAASVLGGSAPVFARPGDAVVLRIEPDATVSGLVVDAHGRGTWALVFALSAARDVALRVDCAPDGAFADAELGAGAWDLVATRPDGRIGRRRVDLRTGESRTDVVIALEPGAFLRLVNDGSASFAWYRVLADGRAVAIGSLTAGAARTLVVPPGALVVETLRGGRTWARDAAAVAGETVAASLGPP